MNSREAAAIRQSKGRLGGSVTVRVRSVLDPMVGRAVGLKRDNWLALIQGGLGPNVWDKEATISAVDFRDAANQAIAQAEDLGGQVVSLEWSYSPNDELTHRREKPTI